MDRVADDMTFINMSGHRRDKEGLRRIFLNDYKAFPDCKFTVTRMISQENTVVVEYLWSGTHTGYAEWLGIPVTNKRVELTVVDIFDLERGKVTVWKDFFNVRWFEEQLRE